MTSHELARALLETKDCPVVIQADELNEVYDCSSEEIIDEDHKDYHPFNIYHPCNRGFIKGSAKYEAAVKEYEKEFKEWMDKQPKKRIVIIS